jgi:hypothetical protein
VAIWHLNSDGGTAWVVAVAPEGEVRQGNGGRGHVGLDSLRV